ncbi:chorismate mutase [Dunaliella salina]|uniref:Chorismate mutase n=1 Tax=Dunaliella salina TaxID=3046 RepID=A0ABQ7GYX7_DUNSA|nr:chorismate mutase [Dunaliella salina]|eukprot:KAF5839812.1 chorismate mutase [Dunaliella salina]
MSVCKHAGHQQVRLGGHSHLYNGYRRISAVPRAATSERDLMKDSSPALSLDNIRSSLIRQEDTIIFNFIERAQFAKNDAVYTPDAVPVPGFDSQGQRYSLLQYVLHETEQLHAKLRRYTSPDEHPFFEVAAPLVLPPITYPPILAPGAEKININDQVMLVYLSEVLPGITPPGDDSNYGSAGVLDVLCLQALSKRIHYGKFVAEAKFRSQTQEYTRLIQAQDADGIMALLTDKAVEKKVVDRVRLKAATFGQDISSAPDTPTSAHTSTHHFSTTTTTPKLKISPDLVAKVYQDWVMPLTKKVEVLYLLQRLGPM